MIFLGFERICENAVCLSRVDGCVGHHSSSQMDPLTSSCARIRSKVHFRDELQTVTFAFTRVLSAKRFCQVWHLGDRTVITCVWLPCLWLRTVCRRGIHHVSLSLTSMDRTTLDHLFQPSSISQNMDVFSLSVVVASDQDSLCAAGRVFSSRVSSCAPSGTCLCWVCLARHPCVFSTV